MGAASDPPRSPPTSNTTQSPQLTGTEEPAVETIEADEAAQPGAAGEDDNDSVLGSESLLSTESVTPSILEFRQLHGRTYANAKTTEYWGPNDDQQSEAYDLIHNALTMLLDNKLFLAPIDKDNPGRVLDVGTGTGT